MLESVREFSREQLEASGEADAIRQRHAAWCLSLAEQGNAALLGPDQLTWLERLRRDHANLLAALAWLHDRGEGTTALRPGALLARFWWYQGHYREGQHELEALLSLPGAPAAGPWWAAAMTGLGLLVQKQGDFDRAMAIHQDAVAAWRALGFPPGLLQGVWAAGYTRLWVDPSAASPFFRESLSLASSLGERWFIGASLWGLGASARYLGQYLQAADLVGRALVEARQTGNPLALSACLITHGQIERDLGHLERAAGPLREALILFRDQAVPWGTTHCLEQLATIAQSRDRPEGAARLLGAAAAVTEAVGYTHPPADEPAYTRLLAAVRDALGEQQFATIWAEGWSLRTAAVAYALTDD